MFTILWQIRQVARLGRDWLYLGYLIDDCRKMSYKRDYQPQEHFVGNRWQPAPTG